MTPRLLETRCCIAGGGPAGMMLGLLLARAGVDVVVLEKHADFLRDFRGDTIHPSTLEVMHELGLRDELLRRPHQEIREMHGQIGDEDVALADFTHLPTGCGFIALMPQWDFLDFLAEHARTLPTFTLLMQTEVVGLLDGDHGVEGVVARTADGELEVRAELTVGADGRGSVVRERAGLEVLDIGAPVDVLWMRIPRAPDDAAQSFGRIAGGHVLVMLDRGDHWQCGYVIAKGGFEALKRRGLAAFREELAGVAPLLRPRLDSLADWDDVKLLTVKVDRLRRWHRAGLLCIGDAAHAMSPIGGVGINLAVQDAVAAGRILAPHFARGTVSESALREVQRRRQLPTRLTQWLQVFVQDRVLTRVLGAGFPDGRRLPLAVRLLRRWPWLRRIPARVIGLGFRPEHVS